VFKSRDKRIVVGWMTLLSVVACLLLVSSAAEAQDEEKKKKKKEEYISRISARAFSISGAKTDTFNVEIGVTRWSTDEERQALLAAIAEGGTQRVTEELRNREEIGFVRFGKTYQTIRYAKLFEKEEGVRQIVLATDRPLGAFEVHRSLRMADYTVALGSIKLKDEGKHEGTIAPYCEISFNEETNHLDVGTFAVQPFRLTSIRVRK
jgi:hypothetical protein